MGVISSGIPELAAAEMNVKSVATSVFAKLQRTCENCALIGGTIIALSGFLIVFEVFSRGLFNWSTGIATEYSGYALAIGSALAFPYCLFERGHIRIDTVTRLLPIKIQVLTDVLALFALGLFFWLLTWEGANMALVSLEHGSRAITPTQTLLFVPQLIWCIALAFFEMVIVYLFVYTLWCAARGDYGTARRVAAPGSADDE